MDTKYYEDGVDRILRILKDNFGDSYSYFNGELINVSEAYLPCIMVTNSATSVTAGATGTDDIKETIIIMVVFNLKDDLGATDETKLTDYRLRKFVEGQDPNTGYFMDSTILGVLRKHYTMDSDTLVQDITVDYTPNVRGDSTAIATQEAYITVNMERMVLVYNRS